ncbi:MAG: hypothetical protein ACYDDQ_09475 [Vulcanimicrobiaceae bacterium]
MALVTPECPGMRREGLDGVVYMALQHLDALVAEMRKDSNLPGDWDPETAVKHYLLYL